MNPPAPAVSARIKYPPGFRPRRGLNWIILGLMYASFYMCRYNFRFAAPGIQDEFHFSTFQITNILGGWSVAYGFGQLLNGLLTDRIGGRTAMLIGALGTISLNFIYGFASFTGTFSTFALIWLLNGYFQSFGAPGMIKINAAWFNRTERGTFAGIFGFMIQSGQFAINNLAPFILGGFAIGTWMVAKDDWRWLFRVPPLITALMAVLVVLIPKETPEEAGYPGLIHDELSPSDTGTRVSLKKSFVTIFTHPLVWFYAAAYACTGAVRNSSDQLSVLYFDHELHIKMSEKSAAVFWTFNLMPFVAVFGSLASGVISDKFFRGHRSPVAMGLYGMVALVCTVAAVMMWSGLARAKRNWSVLGCTLLILVSLSVNATHSLLGTAAAMDIGGRKMAGFASGVIDSFQYFGTAVALPATGWLIDHYGWGTWYPTMVLFGVIGACAMRLVMLKQRRLAALPAAPVQNRE